MTERESLLLEAALRDLGASLEVPEPPGVAELTAAVRTRLARPARRSPLVRVAAAIAVLLLAFAVLVAVSPPVRAGVAHLLRFAGIEFGSTPAPPTGLPTTVTLPGQRGADLAEARRAARFPVAVAETLGPPDQVLLVDGDPPRLVSLLYRDGTIRLDEFDGRLDPALYKKLVVGGELEPARVGEDEALWVDAPHEVTYVDRDGRYRTESARLSGSTLIWQHGDVTLRLEGKLSLTEALEIARSVS
ncbi:MAG: hypothetical protein ACJ72N_18755 [Labedaea sp.]